MVWMMPAMRDGKTAVVLAAVAMAAVAVFGAAMLSPSARGQDKVPGLTGIDRSDEVIQARQLLMDGIETEMAGVELGLEAKQIAARGLEVARGSDQYAAGRIPAPVPAADQACRRVRRLAEPDDGDARDLAGFRHLLPHGSSCRDDGLRYEPSCRFGSLSRAGQEAAGRLRQLPRAIHARGAAPTIIQQPGIGSGTSDSVKDSERFCCPAWLTASETTYKIAFLSRKV